MADPHIGVKAGGADDALHIVHPYSSRLRTLCDCDATTRNIVLLTGNITVDTNSVCWTCADEARRIILGAAA